ncbi:MAG: CsgG/HfaB family protein [Thermodesulfovibrionales bacterium]|nr:CsgG/HfaB family protein [Thermodesulfovibrionales bacterium]
MKIRQLIISVVTITTAAFAASSCAPKLSISEFRQVAIDSKTASHQLPQYVIDKKKAKLAVLPPGDSTQFRTACGLGQSAHENFTQTLAKIGTVEVVERSQLDAFMQEMKFQAGITSEVDANKFMQIAKGVDFVFVGAVSSAGVNASFTAGGMRKNVFTGKDYYANPSCSESGKVLVNYRLITFPSGSVQQVFQLDGQKTNLPRDVSSSYDCRVQNACGLLQEAVYRAIDDVKESLAEAFPVYGYISKTMTHNSNKKNRIAFLSLGKADGVEAGSTVDIVEFVPEKDPVKGTTSLVPRVISECTVTETELFPDRSICVIPEESADFVFVKHAVRTKSKTGVFRGMQKIYRKVL